VGLDVPLQFELPEFDEKSAGLCSQPVGFGLKLADAGGGVGRQIWFSRNSLFGLKWQVTSTQHYHYDCCSPEH
jgi:hypothetical protein